MMMGSPTAADDSRHLTAKAENTKEVEAVFMRYRSAQHKMVLV